MRGWLCNPTGDSFAQEQHNFIILKAKILQNRVNHRNKKLKFLEVVKSGDAEFFFLLLGLEIAITVKAVLRPKIRCDILKCIQSGKI